MSSQNRFFLFLHETYFKEVDLAKLDFKKKKIPFMVVWQTRCKEVISSENG